MIEAAAVLHLDPCNAGTIGSIFHTVENVSAARETSWPVWLVWVWVNQEPCSLEKCGYTGTTCVSGPYKAHMDMISKLPINIFFFLLIIEQVHQYNSFFNTQNTT